MLRRDNKQRGDTLIEVLLAVTVMSLIVTVAWRTMSLGFDRILLSSERSQVQALINGQIALLRAVHDDAQNGDLANWSQPQGVLAYTNPPLSTQLPDGCSTTTTGKKFYFALGDGSTTSWKQPVAMAPTYDPKTTPVTNGHPTPGAGLWIEARKTQPTDTNAKGYYDFYVKACWFHNGQQQLKSAVRLYDV